MWKPAAGRSCGWPLSPPLWANLHGSFFLGPVILLIYGRPVAAAVAGAAALANPYGWNLYRHVFRYLTDSELLARIGEFQSFDFHTPGSGQIIAAVILGIAGGTLALTRKRFDRFALSLLISAMALRSARALPLVALLLLPLANAEISRFLPRSFREYGDRLRLLDSRLGGYVWAPVVVLVACALLRFTPVGFPPDQFPVAAYPHIPAEARLFTSDKYGGYLIYRSNGQRKVFFDGRSDFYGAEFLKQYGRLVQVRPGWRRILGFLALHARAPSERRPAGCIAQFGRLASGLPRRRRHSPGRRGFAVTLVSRRGRIMVDMANAAYVSSVRIERVKGPLRRAWLPAEQNPVLFGVHGAVAEHYKVPAEVLEPHATTLDYIVAAAAG